MADNHNKFDGKVADIDKEKLWEAIHTHKDFPKKKSKRKLMFWFFTGAVLLLLTSGYFIDTLNYPSNEPQIVAEKSPVQLLDKEEVLNKSTNKTVIQPVNAIFDVEEMAESNHESITPKKKAILRKVNEEVTSKVEVETAVQKVNEITANTVVKPQEAILKAVDEDGNIKATNIESSKNDVKQGVLPLNKKNDEVVKKETKQLLVDVVVEKSESIDFVLKKEDAITLLPNPSIKELEILTRELDANPWGGTKPLHASKWTATLHYGIGNTFHNIKVTDSLDNGLVDFYKSNVWVESHAAGLGLERKVLKNWTLGIGLEYSTIYQKFVNENSKLVYKQLSTTGGPYFGGVRRTQTSTIYHTHQFLDVMLSIQRNIQMGKLAMYAKLGTGFNAYYKFKGNYLTAGFDVKESNSSNYKQHQGLYLYGGIGVSHALSKSVAMGLELTAQSKQNLTVTNNIIEHDIWQLKSKIVLRYTF